MRPIQLQRMVHSFVDKKMSRKLFCPDQDCYMYTKTVAAFRESGCHPVCPAH